MGNNVADCTQNSFDAYVAACEHENLLFYIVISLTLVAMFYPRRAAYLSIGIGKIAVGVWMAAQMPTCPARCSWCSPSASNTYIFYIFAIDNAFSLSSNDDEPVQ